MIKYVLVFVLTIVFCAQAEVSQGMGGKYSNNKLMSRSFEHATGENNQLTKKDYEAFIKKSAKWDRKKLEATSSSDFDAMDYNKDGLVSSDEFKRVNLIRQTKAKKTKRDERRIERQKRKGTYKDVQKELDELTKKLDEQIKKEKEKAEAEKKALKEAKK